MIKACIFDMDGTVSNTLNSIAYFGNRALEKFGLSGYDTDAYRVMVGNGASVLVRRMVENNGCFDEALYRRILDEYNMTYDNDFLYLTAPYDGILDLLDNLQSRGIVSAVLSNKPHSTTVKIATALFGNRLAKCYGGRDGVPLKPDPTALFALMQELGVTAEECLYIGDTGTDMQTGKAGGCFTVGVLWGFRGEDELRENGADVIVSDPSQILEIVKEKNAL